MLETKERRITYHFGCINVDLSVDRWVAKLVVLVTKFEIKLDDVHFLVRDSVPGGKFDGLGVTLSGHLSSPDMT